MNGTPSIALGSVRPWKCSANGWSIWFCTKNRTRSPGSTVIRGPGTCPLKAIASTTLPGETSHWTRDTVRSNTFTP